MRLIVGIALALLVGSAHAQQQDPAFLQRALAAMQAQRNQAQDIAAEREAQLTVELAKAQARIKELEAKPDAPAKP